MPSTYTELQMSVSHYMSLLFEDHGFSPLTGRLFTLLLFADRPLSLQDMAGKLEVSKAAVSVQIRTLEREALCRKMRTVKDRKDYYVISGDLGATILRSKLEQVRKFRDTVDGILDALGQCGEVQPQDEASHAAFKERYSELSMLYHLLAGKLQGVEKEWLQGRARSLGELDFRSPGYI
ncbi:GbsR/MarR family transcriptional regulator [Paenibacillus solanacearum]|uniref:GbsR/MarR family transcriptional regulator n=1 Tax=Paenibacillus solanacearum TaxID=2048548 RepID=UPI001C40828D|nr:MarR family transcriptional regulator [Paenibacillus solanacearum]